MQHENMVESAEKVNLPGPWGAHGGVAWATCFLLPLWARKGGLWSFIRSFVRSTSIHGLNRSHPPAPEEGSGGKDDMVPALKQLII